MGLEDLTQLEIIQNVISVISTSIYIIVGVIIIAKYIKYKRKELLTVGFYVIFLTSSRWATNIMFILYLLFDFDMSANLYIFICFGTIPFLVFFAYYTWGNLLYPKWAKKITLITIVTGILYVIFFVILLFTYPSLIGERVARFDLTAGVYVLLYILITSVIGTVFIAHIYINALKSEKESIHWKGRFILIAWLTYIIGSFFDAALPLNIVLLIITKVVFISSAILNYIGWVMPDKVLKWLTKKKG
ncbi:MAG: hypothetical protein ACFFAN_17920 [Promethearchaeota archaeon]